VNAAYRSSLEDSARKIGYEQYYIKHRSLLFNLWIILRTVGTVFTMGER
jgi:lipopolysaccharide/colanic/teichoic acid biosynthesis glycosyltransferase